MRSFRFFFIAVTLFYTLNSHANSTESLVKQFYDWRMKTPLTGLPDEKQLKMAKQFLSSELICLLNVARDYRNRFIKKYPDDKPPFIEGDLFTSMFEGANRYTLNPIHVMGVQASAQLHFYHDQGTHLDQQGWSDTVLLQRKKRQWRITDIQYGGQFEFGNSGSLRQNLLNELSQENKELQWSGKAHIAMCR